MKKLLLALFLVSSVCMAGVINNQKPLRLGVYSNNEAISAFAISSPSVTYATPDLSVAWDPFAGKTNKYAESRIVRVACITKPCHVLFGGSTIGTVDTDDYMIPADTAEYFIIDASYPYLRLIQNTATSVGRVTELY